jgi:hypothetical protein
VPKSLIVSGSMNGSTPALTATVDMRRSLSRERAFLAFLGGVLVAWPHVAGAQPATSAAQRHCDSLPPGPDRTDCYIALSWMNRQQFEIAAGVAQQTKDIARLHRVTGGGHKIKASAAKRRRLPPK